MHEEIAESSYYAHVVVNPLRTTLRRHSGSHWLETRGDRSRRYLRLNVNAGSLWNLLMCISGAVTESCLTEDLFNRARPPPWDWCYIQLLRWMNWASLGKFVCIMYNYLCMHLLTLILCCSLDLKHPGRCPGVTHRWSNCVFNCRLKSELQCEAFRCSARRKCLCWSSGLRQNFITASQELMNTCGRSCVLSMCVHVVAWAEEGGGILWVIFLVDHCGVAVPLNLASDYMFSQTGSTAPRLEYPKFLPRQKPLLNLWVSNYFMKRLQKINKKNPARRDKKKNKKKPSFHFPILSESAPPPAVGQASLCAGAQIKRISGQRRGVHVQFLFCPPQQHFLFINYLLSLL